MSSCRAEDIVEIGSLCTRYALALDRGDWQRLETVFAPDAVMEFAGLAPATGPEAIARVCAGALEPLDGSQHLVGTNVVDVSGDAGNSICYFHAQHVRHIEGAIRHYTVAGTYSDRVHRFPEGWRITHRTQTVSWTSGDPRVLEPS